ncbi:MAG: type II toxin-antitoxin system RelE/ParE family toxin [Acidobacteria bacterium]|nr:type II toxin-antitoxin system RelE/ParE family toxin [Acidobacteriota bacterium]
MRVFQSKAFQRFVRKEKIAPSSLIDAVLRAEAGQIDADLGSGVIKQRIARSGGGKSGGYRSILFFRKNGLAVFVFGFSKSDRDNLDAAEEKAFKQAAKHVLGLTNEQWAKLVENGDFVEVSER